MKNKKVNNRGVTLVELMVALAVLALLMVAVIMMMSNNTVIYRKTKADINIQTTAQETFNTLQDSIMQAKYIELTGYTDLSTKAVSTYKKGSLIGEGDASVSFETLKSVDSTGKITYSTVYPTMLKIQYSVGDNGTAENKNCVVTYYFCRYTEKDQNKCDVYVTREYDSSSTKNDDMWSSTITGWTPASSAASTAEDRGKFRDYLFTSSLEEATFTVDFDTQSFDMNLQFNDKNRVYNTSGIVSVRNSYVMKEMRDRTKIDINITETSGSGDSSDGGGV